MQRHDLREGKQLEGPKGVSNDVNSYDENDVVENEVSSPSNDVNDDVASDANEVPKGPTQTFPTPCTLPLLFPQRMAKVRLDLQFRKFLDVLNKLYLNIPFTNALFQMLSYAKLLKWISSNKR